METHDIENSCPACNELRERVKELDSALNAIRMVARRYPDNETLSAIAQTIEALGNTDGGSNEPQT